MYQVTCEHDEEKTNRINSILFHSSKTLTVSCLWSVST